MSTAPLASEQPFPLNTLFQRRFLPAFLGFAILSLVLVGGTARHVVEQIYLEQAQRRAETIMRAVAETVPVAWQHLMAGQSLIELQNSHDAAALTKAFTDEVREMNLPELKVYDLGTRVLFATTASEIGSLEGAAALREVIDEGSASLVTKTLDDGSRQYELYVPVFDADQQLRTVFELYEPVSYLDAILWQAALPTMAVPTALLLLLILALAILVRRAQRDIDLRTDALTALQAMLSSFVSDTAISAARSANVVGDIVSTKLATTLFYSDIRDFTGFSEQNPPEVVVAFLNQVMTLQVEAIQRHGGDVDKMIGDAVLARFDGDRGGARALAAARDIQTVLIQRRHPRPLGIGIHYGEVISGAIGPDNRRDFTVIGDAVNITARLCSQAGPGEIVVDAALADEAFGAIDYIKVKGRDGKLAIRRQRFS